MKPNVSYSLIVFWLFALVAPLAAQGDPGTTDHDHSNLAQASEEEVFEYNVGTFDPITGEGANLGGFLFPELFVDLTGGVFEPGTNASDLANAEHDPQREATVQAIELHVDVDLDGVVTGGLRGVGQRGEDEWEANLEEAFLHYHVNDWLAIGGGQFLNRFGFQNEKHIHEWDFVNQNLVNSRILNEGEFTTQGGEAILSLPGGGGVVTIGGGGVRNHGHGHEEEEEHHEGEEEEEEHHLEIDDTYFNDWVFSTDARFRLPFDESLTASTSVAVGENGFGENTFVYGFGLEKIWGAHDHGNGPEFCENAVMIRSEFIGRTIDAIDEEEGTGFEADDYGFSTAVFYGINDSTTLSLRHDWVSELEEFEQAERHRISPALTAFLDANQRVRARMQYDYTHGDGLPGEHAAWLQLQIQWGGHGGGHHHHGH